MFNEEGNVRSLNDRLKTVLKSIQSDYELIFINDGSTDHSERYSRTSTRGCPALCYHL
ncbi:MAG: hypothetical protein GTO40_25670 [Deltaproteobacteria bacterium]|nr:hypothetical protein [Deltaproteobacteria bacterium]